MAIDAVVGYGGSYLLYGGYLLRTPGLPPPTARKWRFMFSDTTTDPRNSSWLRNVALEQMLHSSRNREDLTGIVRVWTPVDIAAGVWDCEPHVYYTRTDTIGGVADDIGYAFEYMRTDPLTSGGTAVQPDWSGTAKLIGVGDLTGVTHIDGLFHGASSVICDGDVTIDCTIPQDNSLVNFFAGCTRLVTPPDLITTGVTNMSYLFSGCSSLTSIPPSMDVSSATDLSGMFYGARSLVSAPAMDTRSAVNMSNMFAFADIYDVPAYNTSNVTDMSFMFDTNEHLRAIPLMDTSSVTTMEGFAAHCTALTTIQPLDTSSVTTMTRMFFGATSLSSIPAIDTSRVTDMSYMFHSTAITAIPTLTTQQVTNFSAMFMNCRSLLTIGQMRTDSAADVSVMFANCENVTSGAYDMYLQLASQSPEPYHNQCFTNCGGNSQIPAGWK